MSVLQFDNQGLKLKPEDFHSPGVYKTLRIHQIENAKEHQMIEKSWIKVANVRNPFTRLFSAWNDKSRTFRFSNGTRTNKKLSWGAIQERKKMFHEPYASGWTLFETDQGPVSGRNVSWEAFVEYVASNSGDSTMNHHWRQQANQCQVCHLNYKYILHLENSNEENPFILKKLQHKNKTYVPGRYSWSPADKDEMKWQTIPRKSAIRIYKHYFADFGKHLRGPTDALLWNILVLAAIFTNYYRVF